MRQWTTTCCSRESRSAVCWKQRKSIPILRWVIASQVACAVLVVWDRLIPASVSNCARPEHGGLPPPRVTDGLGIHATANGLCSSVTWEDVEWMGTQTGLPLVLKGVGRAEDALRAAEMPAVKGIVVSNHGAPQPALPIRQQ